MSQATLFILASLLIFALCHSELEIKCPRPENGGFFKTVKELKSYVECIKTYTSNPIYGKRSIPEPSGLFYSKLHPAAIQDVELNPDDMRAIVYEILKAERDFQA